MESGFVFSLSLSSGAYCDDIPDDNPATCKDSNRDPKIRATKKLSTVEFKFSGFSNPAISKSWHRSDSLYLSAISRTMPYYRVNVLYILGLRSRCEPIIIGWFGAHRTSFLLSKPLSVPKPENLSSFRERVMLSSMLLAFAVRASNDFVKVLGLKKVDSMYASLHSLASRSLVDGDLFSDNLAIGCVLDETSDKVSRESNMFSVLHAFGSLSTAYKSTTLYCILSASIKLLNLLCCNAFMAVVLSFLSDSDSNNLSVSECNRLI